MMTVTYLDSSRFAYNVSEVAELLSIEVDTVYDLVACGAITGIRVGPGSLDGVLITREALTAYVEGTSVP
jgi:excisionase family DNA binding protein